MALDSYGVGAALIISCSVLSVLGLLITRKVVNLDRLRATHEVGGYLLSVVGTLYAVLLGLIVVDSMQKFQNAREVTEREANNLVDVYMLSDCLQDGKRREIRKLCADYGQEVADNEWHLMDHGKHDPQARRLFMQLAKTVVSVDPVTERQKALYPQMVSDVSQMWQCRRARTNLATNDIPQVEWISLVFGGIITMFFTYFFGLENLKIQMVMTVMVAVLISLNIYLVLLFGYPFSGDLCVSNESFTVCRYIFDTHLSVLEKEAAF